MSRDITAAPPGGFEPPTHGLGNRLSGRAVRPGQRHRRCARATLPPTVLPIPQASSGHSAAPAKRSAMARPLQRIKIYGVQDRRNAERLRLAWVVRYTIDGAHRSKSYRTKAEAERAFWDTGGALTAHRRRAPSSVTGALSVWCSPTLAGRDRTSPIGRLGSAAACDSGGMFRRKHEQRRGRAARRPALSPALAVRTLQARSGVADPDVCVSAGRSISTAV